MTFSPTRPAQLERNNTKQQKATHSSQSLNSDRKLPTSPCILYESCPQINHASLPLLLRINRICLTRSRLITCDADALTTIAPQLHKWHAGCRDESPARGLFYRSAPPRIHPPGRGVRHRRVLTARAPARLSHEQPQPPAGHSESYRWWNE